MQRFAQAHFVGQDAAKTVRAQKVQPRHALLLVGPQHGFQIAERRTFQFGLAALLGRAVAPRRRRLRLSNRRAAATSLRESPPAAVDAIARRVLLRRAIQQHFLQFLHRAGVNHRHLAVLQPRVVLAGQDQPLDVRRRKCFAAARRKHDAEIKPLHARRRDLKLRLDALQVFQRAVFQLFVQRDAPFALEFWKFPREKIQHGVLPEQLQFPVGVRTGKAAALQPAQRRPLGVEIARGIARRHVGIGQPDVFIRRRDAEGHDARAVGALQQRAQLRETALEREQKARRLRFQREIFQLEIRLHAARCLIIAANAG